MRDRRSVTAFAFRELVFIAIATIVLASLWLLGVRNYLSLAIIFAVVMILIGRIWPQAPWRRNTFRIDKRQ